MSSASRGPLGKPLGALIGRGVGLLGRLEAVLGVVGHSWTVSRLSCTVLETSGHHLGPS